MRIFILVKMKFLYSFCFIAGLSRFGVIGRAVNITSAWFLPQDGFLVFYRYFNDKITWNEAEAVCGFHHADLLSVQTNSQMDAARAYLKELDVNDNIWIGLQKRSPEEPFSWTNGEKLLGEGYWTEPLPKTNEKLCAAIDPVSDFRWNSFYCRGPQVASFVCELSVPEWAKKENGCLITDLPSLTVTYIPEVEVIQLLSDCGLDGTRRIACNSEMNREEIIRRLSCDVDAFASTILSRSTTADAVREINTQQSLWSNNVSPYETTKTYSRLIRHRRTANSSARSTIKVPLQEGTNSLTKLGKAVSSASLNSSTHAFPHSPYSASVRNAPSTKKPQAVTINLRKIIQKNLAKEQSETEQMSSTSTTLRPRDTTVPLHKDFPVLIITGEKLNGSESPVTSESSDIVLMIKNKDLDVPFLIPVSDDVLLNSPSIKPVEVINVDLVEVVKGVTINHTADQTTVSPSSVSEVFHPLTIEDRNANRSRLPSTEDATKEALDVVGKYDKGVDIPQRPNRGRLLTHSDHPSFYPHFLNRVLG